MHFSIPLFTPLVAVVGLFVSPSLVWSQGEKDSVKLSSSSRQRVEGAQGAIARERPLAPLASKRVLVLPVQRQTCLDSLGWESRMPPIREYLASVDDEMTFALKERGLDAQWTLPRDIVARVRRNSAFAVDPHAIAVDQLRIGANPDKWQLRDPLAAQLRALIALSEARYVLIPVELTIANAKTPREVEPRLHLVIIDARRAQLQWTGVIVGASVGEMSPAIAADLISRFAELIAPVP
jgi:hypothetical protein